MIAPVNCVTCKYGGIVPLFDKAEGSLNLFCQCDDRDEFVAEFDNFLTLHQMIAQCNIECNDYEALREHNILLNKFSRLGRYRPMEEIENGL